MMPLETLFELAFDTPPAALSRPELEKLWSTLELLPHAHVDQKAISRFRGMSGDPNNGTAGVYWPQTQQVDLQKGQLTATSAEQYDHAVYMTEEEAITTVGVGPTSTA